MKDEGNSPAEGARAEGNTLSVSLADYTLVDYWMALYRRRLMVLAIVFAAVLAAWLLTPTRTPVYRAISEFFVLRNYADATSIWGTQGFQAAVPLPGADIAEVYTEILKGRDARLKILSQFPELDLDDLKSSLRVLSGRKTGLISVQVHDHDPVRAADVANAYVAYFRELVYSPVQDDTNRTKGRLETEILERDSRLGEALAARRDIMLLNDIGAVDVELEGLRARYLTLQYDLQEAETRQQAIDVQIEALQTSPIQGTLVLLKAEREGVEAQIQGLRPILAETRSRIRTLTELWSDLEVASQDVESQRSSVRNLESARNTLEIGDLQNEEEVSLIIQTATPPNRPILPVMWVNIALSLVLGTLLGVGLAFLLEALSLRRTRKVVEQQRQRAYVRGMVSALPANN